MAWAMLKPESMRFLSYLFAAVLGLLLVGTVSRDAHAQATQSVTTIIGAVQRAGNDLPPHPANIGANFISFADCEADTGIQVTVGMSGLISYQLEVWAGAQGADCTQAQARTAGTTATCWPVINPIANPVNPTTLTIRNQDIVSQLSASPKTTTYAKAGESVCQTAQTTSTAQNITLYFFLTINASTISGNNIQYGMTIDTLASAVQGTVTVGVGDGLLVVHLPSTTDPDVKHWNVYCDPPSQGRASPEGGVSTSTSSGSLPVCDASAAATTTRVLDDLDASDDGPDTATTPVADASVADAAPSCRNPGIDGGAAPVVSAGGACSSLLVAGGGTTTSDGDGGTISTGGTQVILPDVLLCANADFTNTEIDVFGMVNGTQYSVAVAAVDAVGNVGPLSNVVCDDSTTPTVVNDFWTTYRTDGGQAGGGFCALEEVGAPAGPAAFGGAMIALAAGAMARRRRRS